MELEAQINRYCQAQGVTRHWLVVCFACSADSLRVFSVDNDTPRCRRLRTLRLTADLLVYDIMDSAFDSASYMFQAGFVLLVASCPSCPVVIMPAGVLQWKRDLSRGPPGGGGVLMIHEANRLQKSPITAPRPL